MKSQLNLLLVVSCLALAVAMPDMSHNSEVDIDHMEQDDDNNLNDDDNYSHVDFVQDFGNEIHVRSKRQAAKGNQGEICKYKKGTWSECDSLTKLITRTDALKPSSQGSNCELERQLTKKCAKANKGKNSGRQGKNKNTVACRYQRGKEVEFGPCQANGVRTKQLKLLSETETNACPTHKNISKRCKTGDKKKKDKRDRKKERLEKKQARKEKKEQKQNKKESRKADIDEKTARKEKKELKKKKVEEKCEFGDWTDWSECTEAKQQRKRTISKGADKKICQRQATEKRKC